MAAMSSQEREKLYLPIFICNIGLLLVTLYWFGYEVWMKMGLTVGLIDNILIKLYDGGAFSTPYKIKCVIYLLLFMNVIVKAGKSIEVTWKKIIILLCIGTLLFFFPFIGPGLFMLFTVAGYFITSYGFALLGRKIHGLEGGDNDIYETFDQCDKLIENEYSINIPTKYQYKKKIHNGWINVVNPFRATIILGTPGSGKSFSVYNPFISQMIKKDYCLFLYDYKFPDLTEEVYNRYLNKYKGKKKKPKFCILNFDDPRSSMRCNPLDPRYLTEMTDAHEVADLIMKNINPKSVEKEDFFSMSAKVYIAALVWFLKKFKNGIYCSFPHLIELMGKDYKVVFKMLQLDDELRIMIQPFADALKGHAQEQLQGQIASARIPLLRFPSASLYWVLTGDDFSLDLNNPDDPKIICMGNNPDRQATYGTAIALYTSRMFKVINHKYNAAGKRNLPCGVLLDELPTIFIKGLDNLIATARSNRVAIVLGAQDKSQLIRDYTDKEADVIFNTVGNIISGQVNGKTAKELSETMGKEFRLQVSQTSGDSESFNRSYHQLEIMPQMKIETLSQGYFFGKVADNNDCKIEKKLFCGEIQIDVEQRNREMANWQPIPKQGLLRKVVTNDKTGEYRFEGHFNDEKIEQEIMCEPKKHCVEYIKADIMREEYAEKKRDPYYTMYTDDGATKAAEERYDSMEEDDIAAILKKAIKKAQDEAIDKVLQENYQQIQRDILDIFSFYGMDPNGEDGGEDKKFDSENKPDETANGSGTAAGNNGGNGGNPQTSKPNAESFFGNL